MGKPGFTDRAMERAEETVEGLPELRLDPAAVTSETVTYSKDVYREQELDKLSDEELSMFVLGNHGTGIAAIIGDSCKHVVGGAGETYLGIP